MQRPKMTRVISFRVTDEDWFRIERAASDCGYEPHEWCRTLALETAKMPLGINQTSAFSSGKSATICSSSKRFYSSRRQLVESDLWKKYRAYAKQNLTAIADIPSRIMFLRRKCEWQPIAIELRQDQAIRQLDVGLLGKRFTTDA